MLCLQSFTMSFSARPSPADAGWRRQSSGTFSHLRTVFFLDQNLGWAAGVRGTLLRTNDGGGTWEIQKRPSDDTIRDLIFFDQKEGLALCERNIFLMRSMSEVRSYLLHTADGGTTWDRVDLEGNDSDARFTRLVPGGEGRLWLVGEAGALYVTTDRGRTWKRQVSPTRYLLLGGAFLNANQGWLVGGGGSVLRTIDGGLSWRTIVMRNAPGARFEAIAFANANRGWVVGNGGRIFATGDGGRNWNPQNSGTGADLSDVKFLDAMEGWVVGAEGTLLHTTDSGAHWTSVGSGTAHPLERLALLDRTHAWTVGLGGTILSIAPSGKDQPPVFRKP